MKKFLAILLAMMLIMVSVAALASGDLNGDDNGQGGSNEQVTPTAYIPGDGEDDGTDTEGTPRVNAALANGGTITIPKTFDLTIAEGAKLPITDITFKAELKVISDSTVELDDMSSKKVTVSYTNPTTETALNGESYSAGNITIQFPEYPEVGVYTYDLTESGKAAAGLTYSELIKMKVTVIRQNNELKIAGIAFRLGNASDKLDDVTNKYEAGNLKIEKAVDGNLGDRDKDFEVKVTFESETPVFSTIDIATTGHAVVTKIDTTEGSASSIAYGSTGWTKKEVTFTLRHTDTITFKNVPKGVSYTILETTYSDYTNQQYNKQKTAITAGTVTPETITNTKEVKVDTGITLETLPYVLMMALAMMGLVALKLRKREEY